MIRFIFLLALNVILTNIFAFQKVKNVSSPQIVNDNLPQKVVETSGLIYFKSGLWTINDSGGEPCLYKLSVDGKQILQTVCVNNAKNHDWEEVSQDSSFIYIGDFGNNKGQREKLTIYKIQKDKIDENTQTVNAQVINFSYAQRVKSYEPIGNSAYDCEAMVVIGNKIWVFTKNWEDEITELFFVPNVAGDYVVPKIETLQINGLVTATTLSDDMKTLVFLGYRDFIPFVTVVADFNPLVPSLRKAKRSDLLSITGRQTEGIAFVGDDKLIISSEQTRTDAPALFELQIIRKKEVVYIPYPNSVIEP